VHIITFRFEVADPAHAGQAPPRMLTKESEKLLLFNKRYTLIASYNYGVVDRERIPAGRAQL